MKGERPGRTKQKKDAKVVKTKEKWKAGRENKEQEKERKREKDSFKWNSEEKIEGKKDVGRDLMESREKREIDKEKEEEKEFN